MQLGVHGYPTEETDSLTDPDLLMEVLEAREELEEATSAEQVDGLRQANHGMSATPSPCPLTSYPVKSSRLSPTACCGSANEPRKGRSHNNIPQGSTVHLASRL